MSKTYKEFYQTFKLNDFPFDTFTTEQEIEIAKKIFISQGEYDPIIDAFKAERTIIVLGERGSGKTAILEDFKRHSINKDKLFTIIHDYSNLSNPTNSTEIYKSIISNLLIELFTKINKKPFKHFSLSREDKILLSYLLKEFIPNVSQSELKDKIQNIQKPIISKILSYIYNAFRKPLNYAGSVAQNVLYQYLIKHYSFLPVINEENQIHEYFPELKMNVQFDFFDQNVSFQLIKRVTRIAQNLGFKKPVIFFDRLDEDNRFENDAEVISEFLKPFLTDGNLLGMDQLQLVFFVWSTPFRFIQDLIRTQKYYCAPLKWSDEDLKKLLNKRLSYYSNNQISNYNLLFEKDIDNHIQEIFILANSNPRDLIHLFKRLFQEQYNQNSESEVILKETITAALNKFVINFNYYEYYPKKSNARANSMDIYSYAAHLLKLNNTEFTKNQLNDKAGTGSSTNNYVVGMEKIGLIENIRQDKGVAIYKIKDSKVVYCLKNNLELNKNTALL